MVTHASKMLLLLTFWAIPLVTSFVVFPSPLLSSSSSSSSSLTRNGHTCDRLSTSRLYAESYEVQQQEQFLWQRSDASASASSSSASSTEPEIVYILLYNPGTAEEGVYTTTIAQGDDAGREILWAFTDVTDAAGFSELVKAHEPTPQFNLALYPEPIPTPAPLSQMRTAADDMGVLLRVVPGLQSS